MDFSQAKKIHFIGAGGIGISALVKYALALGKNVSASDQRPSEMLSRLEARGAKTTSKHNAENISQEIDLIVYSSAVPDSNPERVLGHEMEIPEISYPEALAQIMKSFRGIAISGTHGKTTTTSMTGKILEKAELDPLVIVGGGVPGWDENLRLPKTLHRGGGSEENTKEQIFVVEACEYRRNMLTLSPEMIALTNIEADHLDYYRDIEDIKEAFQTFVSALPESGHLIANADASNILEIRSKDSNLSTTWYSLSDSGDLCAKDIRIEEREKGIGQTFHLYEHGEDLGEIFLPLPGKFNIANALAAIGVARHLHVDFIAIRDALGDYTGSWRRFDLLGSLEGRPVYSDYAHHPTEIKSTLSGVREFFPNKRILAVFEPHQHSRTEKLFEEFLHAFSAADGLLVSRIYEVAGREEVNSRSAKDLVETLQENDNLRVFYGDSLDETERVIREQVGNFDIILVMGAGDIHHVATRLVSGQ